MDDAVRTWDFSIMDSHGKIIAEDFDYETEKDAEDAAMEYVTENGLTDYTLDVSQPDW